MPSIITVTVLTRKDGPFLSALEQFVQACFHGAVNYFAKFQQVSNPGHSGITICASFDIKKSFQRRSPQPIP